MKIRIIGCSGTGKTYFAQKLSAQLHIRACDLDEIFWDHSKRTYGTKLPIEKRDALLQDILSGEDWIIEGVYYAWCQESFLQADKIYFLDIPAAVYKRRIIIRFLRRKFSLEKQKIETFKSLSSLLLWTDTFQKNNVPEIKELLSICKGEVVIIHSTAELNRILSI